MLGLLLGSLVSFDTLWGEIKLDPRRRVAWITEIAAVSAHQSCAAGFGPRICVHKA
jgi:hypothetical protein